MSGGSCRVGWPGSTPMGGSAGRGSGQGRRLAAALFNKITDAGVAVHPLSTRILLGRTACAASGGAGGPLVRPHFFQHVPPLAGGWASWPVFWPTEAGESHPSHCRASPATLFVPEGRRLWVGPKCG